MSTSDLPRTLNEKTKAPPAERFKDAGEVREFADMLIRADKPRAEQRAKVQGLIDGNRPYPQGVLANQGQGWRANVNYREAEGQLSSQRTPYYDLATENEPCLEVEIDYGRGPQRMEWERKVAAHLHWCFHGWEQLDWHLQLQQSEMCAHGFGTHVFLSGVDWRPKTLTMRHVLFPDRTNSCLDDGLEAFVVREPMRAHQLYKLIRKEKSARDAGWDPTEVKDTIVASQREAGKTKNSEDYQSLLKNNDLGFSFNDSREIWLNHLFVREFEGGKKDRGGISHYIIKETGDEYLFTKRHRFEDWRNIVSLFPYDVGSDGTLHSIRGLGVRIFPFIELSNRLKNHMVDSVLVGSSVLLTQNQQVDTSKLALTSIGPLKLLPPGVLPAVWKPMDLNQGPIALSRELQQASDENNKVFRQSIAQPNVERTAREIDQVASDQSRLQKSAHNMYYRCLDRLYSEMVRRVCNPNYSTAMPGGDRAVEFQQRCLNDGVPKGALAKIVSVKAVRALGAGSAIQRIMIARELMQAVYPLADEASRHHLLRDYVAAISNSRQADRYVPSLDTAMMPDNDDSIAVLENDALIRGEEALVNSRQNHVKHAMRHMGKGAQLLKALQDGQADPGQVLTAWNALGPHTAQHLSFLEQDPTQKAKFEQLHGNFIQLSKFADALAQRLEEQQRAQEAEAALFPPNQPAPVGPYGIPELDLKFAKMKGELDLKAQKLNADLTLKAQKQDASTALADTKSAAEIRRKNAQAAAQAQQAAAKTQEAE